MAPNQANKNSHPLPISLPLLLLLMCLPPPLSRRRSQKHSRTRGLTSPKRRVARNDASRSGSAGCSSPRKSSRGIASRDDGGTARLTDTVRGGASEGGIDDEQGGGTHENLGELHCGSWKVC